MAPAHGFEQDAVPAALLDEALATAETTARAGDVLLHEATGAREADVVARLLDAVWAREAGSVLSPEALIALAHAGGQVTLATRGEDVVGATAAFLGRDHADGTLFVHSHVTGVLPGETNRGVGRALKWHQRAWCLARGIDEVRWTFDPLVRRNAVLNLVVLGARAVAYELDVYGPMADARNAGLPTDRLVASWELTSPRTRAAAAGRRAEPDIEALRRAGAEAVLTDEDGRPVVRDRQAPRRLVQIPADIETLRSRDRELARAWSAAVRATLGTAVRGGARVTGCSRDGWYVLVPPTGVAELSEAR